MKEPSPQPTEVERALAQTFDGWDPGNEGLVHAIAQCFANYRRHVIAPFIAGFGGIVVHTAEHVALEALAGALETESQNWSNDPAAMGAKADAAARIREALA